MRSAGTVSQIVVAVLVALLVGSTSPWWWKELFPEREGSRTGEAGQFQGTEKTEPQTTEKTQQSSANQVVRKSEGTATAPPPSSSGKRVPDLQVPYVLLGGVPIEQVRAEFPAAEEKTGADGSTIITYSVDLPVLEGKLWEIEVTHFFDEAKAVERTVWLHWSIDVVEMYREEDGLDGCGETSSHKHPSLPDLVSYFLKVFGPQLGQTTKRRISASQMEYPPKSKIITDVIQSQYVFKPRNVLIKLIQEEFAVERGWVDFRHVCRLHANFEISSAGN